MTETPRPRRRPDARLVDPNADTRVQPGLPGEPGAGAQTHEAFDSATAVERVERVEERLVPRTRRERAGTVSVRRHVVEEPEAVEVTLRHDELDLERRPADRALEPGEQPVVERGDTTVVLVVEERLEVRKVPWVVEEIHLRRRLVSERRRITDTVRKERIDIESQGDVELTTNDR